MPIFELTIKRFLEVVANFVANTFGIVFENLKTLIFAFSLIISLNLILLWIYYEIKNKDEIGFWVSILKFPKLYRQAKRKLITYEEIKRKFQEDPQNGLLALRDYLKEILEILEYQGESLIEKIEKISLEDLPNKENLIKAIKAVNLIEKRGITNLTQQEIERIYREIELALYHLNIIEKEEFLVSYRE